MSRQTLSDAALGIFVNANRVEAILLRPSGGHFDVVSRFVRQRLKQGELAEAGRLATVLPGLKSSDDADFTIQIGDGGGGGNHASEMFLSGEFVGLGAKHSDPSGTALGHPMPFERQLREILGECRNLGYENPRLAFCVTAPEISYVELFVARDHIDEASGKNLSDWLKKDAEAASLGVPRRRLLELLAAQHRSSFDETRVVFLPMSPLKGQQRFLAIVPEPSESVTATLQSLVERDKALAPTSQLIGSEVSLYAALARKTLIPAENENTAIVRVGGEDTLALFLTGTQVRHFERLRSLTTYDPPETICSRILLQQDEQKIGEVHHVLVLSEARQDQFLETFHKFYPNAAVTPVEDLLTKRGVSFKEEDASRPNSVPAIGIALNLLEAWAKDDPFGGVNLLPKKLRQKPRTQIAFAWHTFAMFAVLFAVTLLFTWRYTQRQVQIDESRAELQLLNMPDPTTGSPQALQARVDSLRHVYTQYTHALHVLDSLLVGSDQWSRTLALTSRATRDLSGVWFDAWQPTGSSIRINGNARSRERVAQLANRLTGTVHETSFKDVKDEIRIYPFTVVVPRPIGMPMVADYLKETAEVSLDADTIPAATVSDTRRPGARPSSNR